MSLAKHLPETYEFLRIAEPYPFIERDLKTLRNASAAQLATFYAPKASNQTILRNWSMQITDWLRAELVSHWANTWQTHWDPRMLATVGILARATPAQGHITQRILVEVLEASGGVRIPTEKDVGDTIKLIYKRAGLDGQKMSPRLTWREILADAEADDQGRNRKDQEEAEEDAQEGEGESSEEAQGR